MLQTIPRTFFTQRSLSYAYIIRLLWLSLSDTAGSTAAGGSTDVTVTFDTSALAPGTYTAALCVNSDDPDEGEVVVNVDLEVIEGFFIYMPIIARDQ